MQKNDVKIGDLFRFKRHMSIHESLEGHIGIVLSKPNRWGQYKVNINGREIHVLLYNMVKI
jgi:hypothetical protein